MGIISDVRRSQLKRERERIELDDFIDQDFEVPFRQAVAALPDYKSDVTFVSTIRSIWRRNGDQLPDNLERVYVTARTGLTWLEEKVQMTGDLPESGLGEVAQLVIALQARHRSLIQLGRGMT